MSQGLIPVVSDWHFNKTVVGDEKLVVIGYEPKDYAGKIDEIISTCDMKQISKQMYERIRSYFAEGVVLRNVDKALGSLKN